MSQTTTEVREHPILFKGDMVRAILDGRKTQTRRVVKPVPPASCYWDAESGLFAIGGSCLGLIRRCPYGVPGDRLWVREGHAFLDFVDGYEEPGDAPFVRDVRDDEDQIRSVMYRADTPDFEWEEENGWRPSIHMPRWASRITLEVLSVRVQRVQEISEEDVIAEGVRIPSNDGGILLQMSGEHKPIDYCKAGTIEKGTLRILDTSDFIRAHFASLWDTINAKRGFGWDPNPWVWVVEFKEATR